MSLPLSLLSIAARGGLRVSFILLTISLFTGLVVVVQSISCSYASEAQILKEISRTPNLAVSYEPKGGNALRVETTSINLNGQVIIMVASENLERYVALHGAKMEGEYPKNREALLGEKLKPHLQDATLSVEGQLLNVSGFIHAPVHLSSAILLTPDTLKTLEVESTTFYYEEVTEPCETSLAEAPSSGSLVQTVIKEVLDLFTVITLLIYSMLALTCITQGYNTVHESKQVLEVFSALGTSSKRMAASLCVLALIMTGGGVALGYAVGIMTSAFASSLVSITLNLPYIKPIADLYLIYWLGLAFTTSSIAVASGFIKGYFSIDGC